MCVVSKVISLVNVPSRRLLSREEEVKTLRRRWSATNATRWVTLQEAVLVNII